MLSCVFYLEDGVEEELAPRRDNDSVLDCWLCPVTGMEGEHLFFVGGVLRPKAPVILSSNLIPYSEI